MLSCEVTRLLRWVDEPLALWGPMEEVGEPALVETESDGECLASRDRPPLAFTPLPGKPADALAAAVALRDRVGPVACAADAARELLDDMDECRLETWRLAAAAAML